MVLYKSFKYQDWLVFLCANMFIGRQQGHATSFSKNMYTQDWSSYEGSMYKPM